MKDWFRKRKKQWWIFPVGAAAAVISFYAFCWFLSLGAAQIFNAVAEHRQLFPGHVTVEEISANFLGRVSFKNLIWKRDDGTLLARIPEGSFRVKLWDVVMRRIGTATLEEAEIRGAYLHVFLNEDMRPVDLKKVQTDGRGNPIRIRGENANRHFDCNVKLVNCTIEVDTPERHFLVAHVHSDVQMNTKKELRMDFSAGPFLGSCAAKELRINGTLDLAAPEPEFEMILFIGNCKPSSLGVGVDIADPVTLNARIFGPLEEPMLDGDLLAEKLEFPGITFTDVKGDIMYREGILKADPVTAEAFAGNVVADGTFNLNEKTYTAHIYGHNLDGGIAAHDKKLGVNVNLKMTISGTREGQVIKGMFYTGEGHYSLLPFKSISGVFDRRSGVLSFHDVVIRLALGDVTTDALKIRKGRVELGPIYLTDAVTGETERVR